MSGPILLEVNHVEVPAMEWGMNAEEVLGGTGRATITVQSRDNSWDPQAHWDVKISTRSTGWVLFRGEIITPRAALPVGFAWTRWVLDCADYNDEIPQRKVGALDGTVWVDVDGFGSFVNVDPYANSLSDDRTTIQALFDHYFRVDGQAADTDEFVGSYLSPIDPPIFWTYTDLQAALEDLASLISVNVQDWLDPDLKFHHQAIPAWQDLAQEVVSSDPTVQASLARLLPEFAGGKLGTAPVNVSDVAGTPGAIGCRELTFAFDGSAMPEQVYIKGGTGYVYNSGQQYFPVTPTGTAPPASGGKYQLTFNAATQIYKIVGGYVDLPGISYGTPGQQEIVELITVPIQPILQTGGQYWQLKTGTRAGWVVAKDSALGAGSVSGDGGSAFAYAVSGGLITGRTAHTPLFTAWCAAPRAYTWPGHGTYTLVKVLSGAWINQYFDVNVAAITYTPISSNVTVAPLGPVPSSTPPPETPPVPTIGIGGSGWTGEVAQDPNKRQAYFDAPVSVSQAQRDSIGGQILYRGSRATVRGSFKVGGLDPLTKLPYVGADGWRAGQLVQIQDARLPASLNGRYFVIQRVGAALIPGNDIREYTIDWGDGPVSRYSAQKRDRQVNPPPVVGVLVTTEDVAPEPGTSQIITGQLINPAGLPWAIPGKTVNWQLLVIDVDGNTIGGQGSLDPIASLTDQAGKAYTTLTAGDELGLTYFAFADVTVV